MIYNLITAQEYARHGRTEEWIHAYLMGGEWANPALSDGLKLQQRWWRGPLELPLDQLIRCCGPEAEMEFRMPVDGWEGHVGEMVRGMQAAQILPLDLPPLIAMYTEGRLSVRDGNHRHECIRRLGWSTAWAFIWYNCEEDYLRHTGDLIKQNDRCAYRDDRSPEPTFRSKAR